MDLILSRDLTIRQKKETIKREVNIQPNEEEDNFF
jgi:hypothetical protein